MSASKREASEWKRGVRVGWHAHFRFEYITCREWPSISWLSGGGGGGFITNTYYITYSLALSIYLSSLSFLLVCFQKGKEKLPMGPPKKQ